MLLKNLGYINFIESRISHQILEFIRLTCMVHKPYFRKPIICEHWFKYKILHTQEQKAHEVKQQYLQV